MNFKKIILVMTFIFSSAAFAKKEIKVFKVVSLPSSDVFYQCKRKGPVFISTWDPSEEDIKKLEEQFKNCISHKVISSSLNIFFRQYAGFVRDGKKMIYLNVLAKTRYGSGISEVTELQCDGSPFGVEYDIESSTFHNFHRNAPETDDVGDDRLQNCEKPPSN